AGDFSCGHVGGPLPCTEIRLVDVPEMGYRHTDSWHGGDPRSSGRKGGGNGGGGRGGGIPCSGRGEVCFRGTNVFAGYYRQEDKTREAFDADGWLHSGDIGLWTADGALMIIDRKKNIFKLSQGEYVAAEKIENIHSQSPLVAQSFVHGDSLQSCLVAVVVPDPDAVATWAAACSRGSTGGGGGGGAAAAFEAACASPELRDAVMTELVACGKRAGLQGFEFVRAVHVEAVPFSVENGMLTPTFKLKRAEARQKYAAVIDDLYASLATRG
ncbi:unnamed protein product, partial [Phaeothamnion confervicola]